LAFFKSLHAANLPNAGITATEMLEKPHLKIDTPVLKCCFSSTMKRQTVFLIGALLAALCINSCGPNTGAPPSAAPEVTSGLRSGDAAISRNSIDAILNNPAPERPGLATGWGAEKRSELTIREFIRASSKPAGTDAIYYNDMEGIKAMSGRSSRVEGMQTAAGSLVEWGIKGRSGMLPAYKEWYHSRRFVAGEKGGSYTIQVKNRSRSALEIVASVDGLDVRDGQPASFSKRGYIVEPGETLEIEGFRTSYTRVAAFKFSGVSSSYANLRHGDTRNVGVIGLAVFTQKNVNPWKWMPSEVERRQSAMPFATAP
jgi:hypothetical protein